jgi:hypothetical protein
MQLWRLGDTMGKNKSKPMQQSVPKMWLATIICCEMLGREQR